MSWSILILSPCVPPLEDRRQSILKRRGGVEIACIKADYGLIQKHRITVPDSEWFYKKNMAGSWLYFFSPAGVSSSVLRFYLDKSGNAFLTHRRLITDSSWDCEVDPWAGRPMGRTTTSIVRFGELRPFHLCGFARLRARVQRS